MEFVMKVKQKYPHLSVDDAKAIVDKAKMFYFGLKYPCEPYADEKTRPINTFFAKNWILVACDEIVDRMGVSTVVSYRENGMSFDFKSAHLSETLCAMIIPVVGVI